MRNEQHWNSNQHRNHRSVADGSDADLDWSNAIGEDAESSLNSQRRTFGFTIFLPNCAASCAEQSERRVAGSAAALLFQKPFAIFQIGTVLARILRVTLRVHFSCRRILGYPAAHIGALHR